MLSRAAITVFLLLSLTISPVTAQEALATDLLDLSLEQLAEVEITSVSKRPERAREAAAAVYVLTADEIRRSPATSLPELLRQVPGVQVARIDSNKWSVSVRGFSGIFSNKLLVLIDGRTVYNPFFGGVVWQAQDVVLSDIERIEVIRGPGASLWGANAVNGVINILTKGAGQTQGGLVRAGGGTLDQYQVDARYGFALSAQTAMRIYGKGTKGAELDSVDGGGAEDDWHSQRGGFRLDWQGHQARQFSLQGELVQVDAGSIRPLVLTTPPYNRQIASESESRNGHLLARWNNASTQVQFYYDHITQDEPDFAVLRYDTLDLEAQHQFRWGRWHNLIVGGGYRLIFDTTETTPTIEVDSESRRTHLVNAFIQDDITLIPERLKLILGMKVEDSSHSDFELQPTVRMAWTPSSTQTVWGAVSRAVRTPSRAEFDLRFNASVVPPGVPGVNPGPLPLLIQSAGNDRVDTEELIAYELGYRWQIAPQVALDATAFYHDYDDLISGGRGTIQNRGTLLVLPVDFANGIDGRIFGAEAVVDWEPRKNWRLQAFYTWMETDMETDTGQAGAANYDGTTPRHQFGLSSFLSLPWNLELDARLRFVDSLPSIDVPSYWNMDLRLGWRPRPDLELSLIGQNLLQTEQQEFDVVRFPDLPAEIPRAVFAELKWRF